MLILQPFRHFTYVTNSFSNPSVALPMSQLILQPFRCFTYVTAHSSTFFVTSPTSKLIFQPFCCFTYVTAHSPTLMLLHLCHSSFSNPSFASPTSQALHLIHLASRLLHVFVQNIISDGVTRQQNSPALQNSICSQLMKETFF